jgi:Protein of unknown function (DUF2934)
MDRLMQEKIAKVAYELYEKRGRQHGHQDEDWLAAEKLVLARIAREGTMKKATDARASAQKMAAGKEIREETRKKPTKPLSKGKKISREASLS